MAINSLSTLTEFPSLWSQNGSSIYYNSGNLGIGLSNPGSELDVVGDINFSGNLLQNGVIMTFGQFDTDGDGTSIVYNNGGEVVLDKIRSNTLGNGVFTIRDCTNSTGKWQNRIGTDDSYNLDYYNGSSWSNCVFVDTIGLNVNAASGKRLSIRNASGISNNEDLGGVSWMQEGSTGTVVGNIFMLGDSDGGTTGRGKMFFGVRGNDSNQSAICQMSLDSFGNVNIGGDFTSSSKLYVGKTSWAINEANPLVNFAVTASGTNGFGSYTSRIMKLYSDGSFTSEQDNGDNIIGLEIEMDVTGPVNKIPLRITGDNNYNYDFTSQSDGVTPGRRLDMFVGSSGGEFSFSNSGGELLRIKGDGKVLVGTDTGINGSVLGGAETRTAQFYNTIDSVNQGLGVYNISNTPYAARIEVGTAKESYAALSSGNYMGILSFVGSDGAKLVSGAMISAEVDGTVGVDDLPTRLVFSVTEDGSSSPTERMRIDSSGNVKINAGILTTKTNTSGKGTIHVGDTSTGYENEYQYINFGGVSNTQAGWQIGKADQSGSIAPSEGFYIFDFANATTRMVIDTSGNVGINQNNPIAKLEVVDTNNEILLLKQTDGPSSYMTIGPNNNTGAKIGYDNLNSADLVTIGHHTVGNVININSSGKVGIGTTNPRNLLELGGTANRQLRIGGIYSGPTSGYTGLGEETTRHEILFSSWRDVTQDTVGAKITAINKTAFGLNPWYWVQYTDLVFSTLDTTPSGTDNTTEKMRILSNGNVGIGTDSPNQKLVVSDSGIYGLEVNPTGNQIDLFAYNRSTSQYHDMRIDANEFIFRTGNPIVERIRILSDGKVGIGTPSPDSALHLSLGGTTDQGDIAFTIGNDSVTARQGRILKNTSAPYDMYYTASMNNTAGSCILFESKVGSTTVAIDRAGAVAITPDCMCDANPLGTLCLDITGSTNPQNGGLVMNSTTQTHIRFLSSGNLCWQWRHHSPADCDVFSVYSWKRGCDMFMIKAPIDTDTGFTSFGPYGHIISCSPLLVGNTGADPYFQNIGGKCQRFYTYRWGTTTSCFPQTHFMVRFDSSPTNVCQVYPTATLYNANETEGTSSTLAFAGREVAGGNSVGLAYISGRKESSVNAGWASGSLNFLVVCNGCQCWTTCMTMCGGVCVIKCLVAPSIQLTNNNCVLCLAGAGTVGAYIQGSADCTTSYWGIDHTWKAQINSTGGFCAANCVVAPVVCGTTCLSGKQIVLCQEGTGNEMLACFIRNNSGNTDNHYHKIDVNPDTNLVTLTSSGTNAGGYCMFCYVNSNCFTASVIVKSPILCATTCSYIGQSRLGAGFSTYTNDGLFHPHARPSSIGLSNGAETIMGYHSNGNGFYWGRMGHRTQADSGNIYGTLNKIYCQSWGAWSANCWAIALDTSNNIIFSVNMNSVCAHGTTNLCVGGNIEAQGDVTSASDCRLKSNITYIKDAIGIVNNLCGRIFIKNNKEQIGVIAQEVEKVLPQVVFQGESEDDMKSVSYGNMVGVLIEAIKEQQQQINELKQMLEK